MNSIIVGVIGGTGLYEINELTDIKEVLLDTPFGNPSDAFITGIYNGVKMVFLSRHGRGHIYCPHEINYRANIWGMKKLGVTHIISVSACGSLQEEIKPGHIVIIDQFIDRTNARESSFFGKGCVAHVPFADPICNSLSKILYNTGSDLKISVHHKGTYICINGPAFSTRAESRLYRTWGGNVIGMTNITEAKLAREAEICYSTIALATDYDCWRTETSDVSLESILQIMKENVKNAKDIVFNSINKIISIEKTCHCQTAMSFGSNTQKDKIPKSTLDKVNLLIGKYLK